MLEGLNSFASSFYFYYLFFFMQKQFGFGNLGNLSIAALNGLIYTFVAWFGGRFGQKFGYFRALRLGFGTLAFALTAGGLASTPIEHVEVMVVWTIGLCFTWPNLEALASEKEDAIGLQEMVGIYNLVWAGSSATAYFMGGILLEKLGPRSLFWIPVAIHLTQLVIVSWIERQTPLPDDALRPSFGRIAELNPRPIARARSFLRMAWWANPFAYVAINTVAAVVPGLAQQMGLSPMQAGFCCSVWLFARFGTFLVLWLWRGWQYRLRWFIGAYLLLAGSFATILLVRKLGSMIGAQITFGSAVGLLYYSSLFYSMDVGEAKGEHGGMHESAIGAGLCAGPAIGAVTLSCLPEYPNSSAWAVSLALCGGLIGLIIMGVRWRSHMRGPSAIT